MYAVNCALVEVDVTLGTVKVIKVWAAHDVGRAINPLLAEGQIEGGIMQGVGLAVMEELVVEWSRTKTSATTEQLRLSAAMLYSMLDYFMHLWLIQGWEIERERAIDAMSDALLAAMR